MEVKKKNPSWNVYKQAFGSTHYSDPVITFGPFKDKEEAEGFAARNGGTVYDHNAPTFGDRELLGIYD